MWTAKRIVEIIKAFGWQVSDNLAFEVGSNRVLVKQWTPYGVCGFRLAFKGDELIYFEAIGARINLS